MEEYQVGRSSRELADAENVEWAQQLYGKTMVYAHNGHLAKASPTAQPAASATNAGAYLAKTFNEGYILFATDTKSYCLLKKIAKPLTVLVK
jgi:erythromycin esterase-like protein